MKTTNTEGGMRESIQSESIFMQTSSEAKCCPTVPKVCSSGCFNPTSDTPQVEDVSHVDLDTTQSMEHRSTRVTPNNQQDMWVKYLIRNLRQIDDLEWCQSLLVYIDTEEHTFNTGKFRGALFHLNF